MTVFGGGGAGGFPRVHLAIKARGLGAGELYGVTIATCSELFKGFAMMSWHRTLASNRISHLCELRLSNLPTVDCPNTHYCEYQTQQCKRSCQGHCMAIASSCLQCHCMQRNAQSCLNIFNSCQSKVNA